MVVVKLVYIMQWRTASYNQLSINSQLSHVDVETCCAVTVHSSSNVCGGGLEGGRLIGLNYLGP